jgi:hypothetical protein
MKPKVEDEADDGNNDDEVTADLSRNDKLMNPVVIPRRLAGLLIEAKLANYGRCCQPCAPISIALSEASH